MLRHDQTDRRWLELVLRSVAIQGLRRSYWRLGHKCQQPLFFCQPTRMCRPARQVRYGPWAVQLLSAASQWQHRSGDCLDKRTRPLGVRLDLSERGFARDPNIAWTLAAD